MITAAHPDMWEAQELESLQTQDAVVPSLSSSSLPFDHEHSRQLSSRNGVNPILLQDNPKEEPRTSLRDRSSPTYSGSLSSSSPVSPCSHHPLPSLVQEARRANKLVIPMDIPVSRASQDPLLCPILEAESNDVYRYAKEGRKVIIGPMPVRTFLNEFLPPAPRHAPMPKCSGTFNKIPSEPRDEGEIYNALCAALDEGKRCPSLNFCITAGSLDQHVPDIPQPEISAYDASIGPPLEGGDTYGAATSKPGYQPGLGCAELFVLVCKSGDPFCDTHSHDRRSKTIRKSFFAFENHRYQQRSDFDAGAKEKRNLGRAVSYVSIACSRQHRVFYFSILVFGTRARFIRYDRAGGIVTASFDYRRQPEPLCEFLWRFHHANLVQRGHDPTVINASRAEEDLFRKCVRQHVALQLGLSESDFKELDEALALHYESGKVMKMQVYDKCQHKMRLYLISVPLTSPRSADGRSTRAYWAVEPTSPDQGEVRLVKDVWRIEIPGIREEGMVYDEMGETGVVNICNCEASWDVCFHRPVTRSGEQDTEDAQDDLPVKVQHGQPDQRCARSCKGVSRSESSPEQDTDTIIDAVQSTKTNDYVDKAWVCRCLRDGLSLRVRRHVHSRVVLKEAGYPLRTFKGSRELFGGAKDALEALDSAYSRCRRIHRDVSMDNIILYRDEASRPRRGLLVDWEFSTVVDDSGKSTDGYYTGTWAFLSARILRHRDQNYQTQEDDMESLFYVIMYGCLRWLPSQRTRELGYWLYDFFDKVEEGYDGRVLGGTEKYLQQGYGGVDFLSMFKFENKHIQSFFKRTYKLLITAHVVHREELALLWTMDRFRALCTSVCDSLSSDESNTCDRAEQDASHYLVRMRKRAAGTETCLLADAIFFHAEHGTVEVPSRRILEEATDDIDPPGNRRGRKRGRFEALDNEAGSGRRMKRRTGGYHLDGIRSPSFGSSSNSRSGKTYNLRSRCSNSGSFTSSEGNRRSARLALKEDSAGLKRRKHT